MELEEEKPFVLFGEISSNDFKFGEDSHVNKVS